MKIEPNNDIRQATMAMFECYTGFIDAGFTENQALALVAKIMTHNLPGGADEP